ncbi:hypothetical protein DL546_008107 [Coniochaeta pulveracea]|uniref:Uncharacterized protein n=1 Tax=Coniochaeta pulveracea TaxID=177199 RepID=A0A420YF05_9PEZI|nr:hypothetical protein DL546_008107 [Coniochaeta pulveracea]
MATTNTTVSVSAKPTLSLATPKTANFPTDVLRDIPSAISATTPLSALSRFREPFPSAGLPSAGLPSAGIMCSPIQPMSARIKQEEKTPITPPLAYLDFLKSISLQSPPLTGKTPMNRTSTSESIQSVSTTTTADSSASEPEADSAPTTAASEKTDLSCKCGNNEHDAKGKESTESEKEKERRPTITTPPPPAPKTAALSKAAMPTSPLGTGPRLPMSAPPSNLTFPSLNVPASPACSNRNDLASPMTPWSARSIRSPFDWDAALKARRYNEVPGGPGPASAATTPKTANAATKRPGESRSTVRHIREVVTRTVTYTPRMEPAPKGKRRKLDDETAVET